MPTQPKVSFVVPCYKLAHLLAECVNSMLSQTYDDFEVLIMDDCSPDNTPEVAQSFNDPRVKHIRNEPNLGHLRNYNKGISLAQGKYVWLISADDRLRVPYVLERYVRLMEQHPEAGFACCPGMELENGQETRVAKYSIHADHDTIFRGHEFLRRLLTCNSVIAASGMVRRACYKQLGSFPLDLPYAGDWYLWCLFALYHDVAYLAEPMVNYRGHELSMTSSLLKTDVRICVEDDLAVLWRIKQQAEQAGYGSMVGKCRQAIAYAYARQIAGSQYRASTYRMSLEEFGTSLCRFATDRNEATRIRARVYGSVADRYFERQDLDRVAQFYRLALGQDSWLVKVWVKRLLLHMGWVGIGVRQALFSLRKMIALN